MKPLVTADALTEPIDMSGGGTIIVISICLAVAILMAPALERHLLDGPRPQSRDADSGDHSDSDLHSKIFREDLPANLAAETTTITPAAARTPNGRQPLPLALAREIPTCMRSGRSKPLQPPTSSPGSAFFVPATFQVGQGTSWHFDTQQNGELTPQVQSGDVFRTTSQEVKRANV